LPNIVDAVTLMAIPLAVALTVTFPGETTPIFPPMNLALDASPSAG
jgi:hypothetical protein